MLLLSQHTHHFRLFSCLSVVAHCRVQATHILLLSLSVMHAGDNMSSCSQIRRALWCSETHVTKIARWFLLYSALGCVVRVVITWGCCRPLCFLRRLKSFETLASAHGVRYLLLRRGSCRTFRLLFALGCAHAQSGPISSLAFALVLGQGPDNVRKVLKHKLV